MPQWRTVRRVSTAEPIPPLRSRSAAVGWLALTSLAYAALAVCALVPTTPAFVISAVAVAGCEVLLGIRAPFDVWALDRVGVTGVARGLLRGVALVVFAGQTSDTLVLVCVVGYAVVAAASGALRGGLAQVVSWQRRPPITCRGLALPRIVVPAAPGRLLVEPLGVGAIIDAIAACGLAVSAGRSSAPAVVVLAPAALLVLAAPALLARDALRLHRLRLRDAVSAAVHEGLLAYAPEVVVYFGNTVGWRYQIEMWLETLERVEVPVVVIVRDRDVLRLLAPTSLPIVCMPGAATIMGLDLPSVRVALYVGNAGNNVNMLRRPGVRSVFIGHGDSDKGASFNPFSRVYDEIWVAGQAGRNRYADADVRIAPDECVEVGRPQLRDLVREPDAVPRLTVLYAPTWEGWGEDPFHSSLVGLGPELVRTLLRRPDVRVMYRPHPRTGHRDPTTRRAHQAIVDMLHEAGAPADMSARVGPMPSAPRKAYGDLLDDLVRPAPAWSRAKHTAAVSEWDARYWAASPGHRVLTHPAPDLYACFSTTDVLIADVSSVTTDFLATDRPYAIVNVSDEPEPVFRQRIPSTAGGFVLGRDLAVLDQLLAAAGPGPDPTATGRAGARDYLLGPRTPDPTQTFRAELKRLLS